MRVTEIQRFCMHDGPGIRTTVFLKGCPLRCFWCHNPEAQERGPEILFYRKKCISCGACESICPAGCHTFGEDGGHVFDRKACSACGKCADVCPAGALAPASRDMSAGEVFKVILSDKAFYGSGGGVTLSGGEPFLQAEEALRLLKLCRDAGINTAVETSGFFDPSIAEKLPGLVDLLLWDCKDADGERLRANTGASGRTDAANLRTCDALGIRSRLRLLLVRGVNDDFRRMEGAAELFKSLVNCECVEILPYHPYGGAKEEALGRPVRADKAYVPTDDEVKRFAEELEKRGVKVKGKEQGGNG